MDSNLRPAYNTQAPLVGSSASFAPSASTLAPSTDQSTMTPQAQSTLEVASNVSKQVFSSPSLQPSACAPQTSASVQPLSQTLSNASNPAALPIPPAAGNSQGLLPLNAAPAPAENYPHQINGLGGPTATAPFLQDFNLVAEAAKRAQMGIVMRDLESVTL